MNEYQREFLPLVVYQIYPRSFCDGNGDGVGDFQGIASKLPYLARLGVNAVWLSPCFQSPQVDNGYDISDFRDTNEEYGSLEEFKALIQKMHEHGLKVILDLVANHTSDKHKWFVEARKSKDNPYRDYYYWAKEPLNDWQACFGGSAWEYDEGTKEYYLHSYAKEQPDLNWTNPKVRKEIKDIVYYWVNLGVDGFRCDVLDQIAKDFSKADGNGNGPLLGEYIHELFGDERLKHIFTVGECWGLSLEKYRSLCAEEKGALKSAFSFGHLLVGQAGKFEPKPFRFQEVTDILYRWTEETQADLLYPLVLENHDQPRILSKYGDEKKYRYESATMLATFTYLLKGIPFLYQGQEIGLPNPNYGDIAAFDDIETLNYYRAHEGEDREALMKKINFGSRDNARRLLPWEGTVPEKSWLPPHNLAKTHNVAADLAAEKSVYAYYQRLLKLRRETDTFLFGKVRKLFTKPSGCTAYERTGEGKRFLVLCNHKEGEQVCVEGASKAKVVLSNYGVEGLEKQITLRPYEALVLEME